MEAESATRRCRFNEPALLTVPSVCDRLRVTWWRRLQPDDRMAVGTRVTLFALCLAIALTASGDRELVWLAPLLADIVLVSVPSHSRRVALLLGTVDAVVAAVCIIGSGGQTSPLLPYLVAPAVATAARAGELGSILPAGAAAFVLLGGLVSDDTTRNVRAYTAAAAEWVLLALVLGYVTSRIREMLRREAAPDQQESYAAAYRLLSQLRTVARQLAGGLDPVTLAEGLLASMREVVAFDRAAVFTRSQGGRLVPLAVFGSERVDWDVSLSGDNSFAEAWASQRPIVTSRAHLVAGERRPRPGSAIVLPLRVGVRSIGVIGLEAQVPWQLTTSSVADLGRLADESALRLETALLFDEVREVATVEERRRLAREIHDGVAQELASFGYIVDELVLQAVDVSPALADQLRTLRREFTRVISELRLSIFDLRSEVDTHGGLGATLAEYVRSVGTGSDLTVHLSLDETPHRLPPETEAELLRIAQEAITNARKHARAENLWVTCQVDPPSALLRVEDDGAGMRTGRHDSFGLEIMRERAERLRATFEVRSRSPRGTSVEVVVKGGRTTTVDDIQHAEGSRPR